MKRLRTERMRSRKEMKGQMTLQATLLLAVMIPVVLLTIEGARQNGMKLQIECVVDMGMDSVLAEYHRELLRQYDLLFIDTSYEGQYGSLENTTAHLEGYMQANLHPEEDEWFLFSDDFYGLNTDYIEIVRASRATDENGAVFRRMAIAYMLEKYGYTYVEDVAEWISIAEEEGIYESDILAENQTAQEAINNIVLPEPEEGEEWVEVSVENPTEGVNEIRNQGILSLVCENEISGVSITPEQYVSERDLVAGDGLCEEWDTYNDFLEELLFQEYMIEKCGSYTDVRNSSLLKYELEYLYMGRTNDTDNLRGVAERLLLIRGGANTISFFADDSLKTQAKAMASALAVVVALPELEGIFEAAIIASWIYAESLYDVKLLFSGEEVPLVKPRGVWYLSLDRALGISAGGMSQMPGSELLEEGGLSYEDYLRLMLYTVPSETKTKRMMNIIEMNIRQIEGEENFCMDNCIAAADVQIIFVSEYGYEFLVNRRLRYW